MATAIEFNHVGKQYRLGLVSTGTLSHDLNRWWQTAILRKDDPYLKIGSVNDRTAKADSEYVWALRDIDFRVEQGDVVGIIGKNGAGKSTLLKLLSKVTGPTVGSIRARGRIASLLEVGTGFHGEMTGRENIFLNGAILGMTKQEITAKLDEIVDFSGCERYLDTPVKRYSSGMTVRLGFAVAAFLDPEILVVDEVLAVGDAEFQKKAIGKMQDVSQGEGRTVLFVSHNMASVQRLCNRGVVLKNGSVHYKGNISDAINVYLNDSVDFNEQHTWTHNVQYRHLELVGFEIIDEKGYATTEFFSGTDMIFRMTIENHTNEIIDNINELTIGIESTVGENLIILDNKSKNAQLSFMPGKNVIEYRCKNFPLSTGSYRVGFYLSDNLGVLDMVEVVSMITVNGEAYYSSGKVHHKSKVLLPYDIVKI